MDLPSTVFGLGFSSILKSVSGRIEKPFWSIFSIPAKKIILTNDYPGTRSLLKREFI